MKILLIAITILAFSSVSVTLSAQSSQQSSVISQSKEAKHFYIDVHELNGKVKFADVEQAHKKDLAVEQKYGVNFLKYWVDENKGLVYCLSSSSDTSSIIKTHAEAHGLLPANIYEVTDGQAAKIKDQNNLFLDIHYLGTGNATAKAVEEAHKKDLAIQSKYKVNFINYWVNEKNGVVMCLSEAKDPDSIIKTHKEAHGLIPDQVLKVKQGQ